MIGVCAFAAFADQPVARQALAYLSEARRCYTALLDETARPEKAIAVFVVSAGDFPSSFIRKLPQDPEKRRADIERRGFTIPEGVLGAQHLFVLKPPQQGGVYGNGMKKRFFDAVDGVCGFVTRTRPSRRHSYLARQEQKRLSRRRDLQVSLDESLRRIPPRGPNAQTEQA